MERVVLTSEHAKETSAVEKGLADFTASERRVSKDERDLVAIHKDMQKALIKANKPSNSGRNLTFTEGHLDIDPVKGQAAIFEDGLGASSPSKNILDKKL